MTQAAANPLTARIGELMRVDDRIAVLTRDPGTDSAAQAAAILEAIAAREQIAAAILEAIDLENQALHSQTTAAPAGVIRRNRALEALAKRVEIQSREYDRIAHRLEADRANPRPAPV